MKLMISLPLCALLSSLSTLTAATNLIVNGSFEQPPVPLSFFSTFMPPSTFLGWTPVGDGVDILGTHFVQSAVGVQSLELNNVTSGGVYQDVVTSPGEVYRLSFVLGANTDGVGDPRTGPAVKSVRVQWGTNIVAELSHDVTGHTRSSVGWRQFTFDVKGTGHDRLLFESLTPGWTGAAIDNVSVRLASSTNRFSTGLNIENAVKVCWPTVQGQLYQVQWADRADTNMWTDLGLPLVGDGQPNCVYDPTGDHQMKIYRVLIQDQN